MIANEKLRKQQAQANKDLFDTWLEHPATLKLLEALEKEEHLQRTLLGRGVAKDWDEYRQKSEKAHAVSEARALMVQFEWVYPDDADILDEEEQDAEDREDGAYGI